MAFNTGLKNYVRESFIEKKTFFSYLSNGSAFLAAASNNNFF
jgi:hypothetical protein